MKIVPIVILLLVLFLSDVYSQPAQFRGANRDGTYPDTHLLTSWPENGPPLKFRVEGIGVGHSSPVVYNETIFISGKIDSFDVVSAFGMNGEKLWQTKVGKAWYASYSDTRSTPTIEDNRIYFSSGMGEVVCLDAKTGSIIWKQNPHDEFKGAFGSWGKAESLLLTDKAVISCVGGEVASIVALDKKDGSLVWKSPPTGDKRAYVTPISIDRNGQKLIIAILSQNILGVDAGTGEILWTFDLVKEFSTPGERARRNNTNSPLYRDGEIFVTSGYDSPAAMFSLSADGRSVKLKWKNDVLDTHHGGVVEVNGYIYGSNWHSNSHGNWVCLEWETGKVMYEEEWINKGQVIYADGHLICKEEKTGNVALVPATPSEFKIAGSFQLDKKPGPYWSHPAMHDGKLLIRQGDALMVFDIKKQ